MQLDMLALDGLPAEPSAAAMALSTAARRLVASLMATAGRGSPASEASPPVLQSLRQLLAWLHQSLSAVLGGIAGNYAQMSVYIAGGFLPQSAALAKFTLC